MRAITKITIRKEGNNFTMFLNYNNKDHDYSFNSYKSETSALESLPINDAYFPIKTNEYRFMEIKGNQTLFNEVRVLKQ